MLEQILEYERGLFFLLNGSSFPFLDRFFWLISGKIVWAPLIALIIYMLVRKKPWKEYLLILAAIVILITICDQFTSHFCKQYFVRLRPTHHPLFMDEVKTIFGYKGGLFGFMSSHAANAFGFAVFMSALFKNKIFTAVIMLWALLTAYSRIYLGVHFISDVVAGGITGAVFGYMIYALYAGIRRKVIAGKADSPAMIYSEKEKIIIAIAISGTIMIFLLFNKPLINMLI